MRRPGRSGLSSQGVFFEKAWLFLSSRAFLFQSKNMSFRTYAKSVSKALQTGIKIQAYKGVGELDL
jgi:hypothetical protein